MLVSDTSVGLLCHARSAKQTRSSVVCRCTLLEKQLSRMSFEQRCEKYFEYIGNIL